MSTKRVQTFKVIVNSHFSCLLACLAGKMKATWLIFCIGILWKSYESTECPHCHHSALRSENYPQIAALALQYQRNDFKCAENRITSKGVCGINEICSTHYHHVTGYNNRRYPDMYGAKVEIEMVDRGCGSFKDTDCQPLKYRTDMSSLGFSNTSFSGYECTTTTPRAIDLKIHEGDIIDTADTDKCAECMHTAYRFVNGSEDIRPRIDHYNEQNNFDCAENRHLPPVKCPESVPCINTYHLYEARGISNKSDALLQIETVHRTCDPDGRQVALDLGCKTTFKASPNDEIGDNLYLSNFTEANSTLVVCKNKGTTDFRLKINGDTITTGTNVDGHISGTVHISNSLRVIALAYIFGCTLC
ncbi:uncharacterized protein LOC127843785 isoform X2 [Dreissena polymorpha]|uniref:Uncharacterized protein n=1 Tax=Dreissena polymorpha TaxID=45954 RepID=A0A9D4EGV9_DREPO|nr:uncharacterized protein LOC127843785 isoform X2 [Dreissena polymorpha]KAH3778949.1 hypothetical protein DPMN_180428 [Dreissena polymorpha]